MEQSHGRRAGVNVQGFLAEVLKEENWVLFAPIDRAGQYSHECLVVVPPSGIAIEPGVDVHRVQSSGTTAFLGNLSARLDYALHGGWYAAAGGNLNYVKTTGTSAATRTGANVGLGYRFPFWGPLGGRVELNYTMFGKNTKLATGPTNTVGLMFGALVPLR